MHFSSDLFAHIAQRPNIAQYSSPATVPIGSWVIFPGPVDQWHNPMNTYALARVISKLDSWPYDGEASSLLSDTEIGPVFSMPISNPLPVGTTDLPVHVKFLAHQLGASWQEKPHPSEEQIWEYPKDEYPLFRLRFARDSLR